MEADKNYIRIGFIGDTSFTGVFSNLYDRINDDIIDEFIVNNLTGCDDVVLNLEGPLTSSSQIKKNNGVSLLSLPQNISILKKLNVTIVNLANNHIMDYGNKGLIDTISMLSLHGIDYFGGGIDIKEASREIIIKKGSLSVALLSACHNEGLIAGIKNPGVFCADKNRKLLKRKLKSLKEINNWVVYNYHGGEEYIHCPMPDRRKRLFTSLRFGADIVIAHHSHVVQPYEIVGKKTIFYSLGNFVFDIPIHNFNKGTEHSFIVIVDFFKDHYKFQTISTCCDKKNGIVYHQNNSSGIKKICTKSYRQDWIRSCYDYVFASRIHSKGKSYSSSSKKFFHTSIVLKVISIIFSKTVIRILSQRNIRPIYIGALQYIIAHKVKFSLFRRLN